VNLSELQERAAELRQLVDIGKGREADSRKEADGWRDSWQRAEGALIETEGWIARLSTPPPPPRDEDE